MVTRRSMLLGLTASLIAAPAVIRTPGLLMKIVEPKPELNELVANWMVARDAIFKTYMQEAVMQMWCYGTTFTKIDEDGLPCVVPIEEWSNPYDGAELIRADWPSLTIKAPSGGFKIART